jgi:hypothetical protein
VFRGYIEVGVGFGKDRWGGKLCGVCIGF